MDSVQIIFDAIDNTKKGIGSVMGNLNALSGAARMITNVVGQAYREIGKAADALVESARKTGNGVSNAIALSDAYGRVGENANALSVNLTNNLAPGLVIVLEEASDLIVTLDQLVFIMNEVAVASGRESAEKKLAIELWQSEGSAIGKAADAFKYLDPAIQEAYLSQARFAIAAADTANGIIELNQGLPLTQKEMDLLAKESAEAAEAMRKFESAVNQTIIASAIDAQGAFDDLKSAQQKYIESINDLDGQLAKGEISLEEYNKRVGEVEGAYDSAAAASKRWVNGFIVDMMTMLAMADGAMSSPEMQGIMGFMQAAGMVDAELSNIIGNVVTAFSSGDPEAIEATTNALIAYEEAASAKPFVPSAPPSPFVMPTPESWKKGEPVYSDEAMEYLKNTPGSPYYEAPPPETSAPTTAPTAESVLPTPQQATGTKTAGEGMKQISEALSAIDAEKAAALTAMFDSITAINAEGIGDAISEMKKLLAFDGRTIDIYTTNHITEVTTTAEGGTTTEGTTTGGTTTEGAEMGGNHVIQNYGTINYNLPKGARVGSMRI